MEIEGVLCVSSFFSMVLSRLAVCCSNMLEPWFVLVLSSTSFQSREIVAAFGIPQACLRS